MSGKPRLLHLAAVAADPPPILATKVTGHNIANITYLTSKAAERGGYEFTFKAKFWGDGSLDYVEVPGPPVAGSTRLGHVTRNYRVAAGGWLYLAPDEYYLAWAIGHPIQSGLFRELTPRKVTL